MRGQQHVVEAEIRRILERLLAEDVERRTCDVTRLDSLGEGLIDDQFAAGTFTASRAFAMTFGGSA